MCAVDAMHLRSEPPVEDHRYKIEQFYNDNRLDIIQSTQPVHSLVIFLMQTDPPLALCFDTIIISHNLKKYK